MTIRINEPDFVIELYKLSLVFLNQEINEIENAKEYLKYLRSCYNECKYSLIFSWKTIRRFKKVFKLIENRLTNIERTNSLIDFIH